MEFVLDDQVGRWVVAVAVEEVADFGSPWQSRELVEGGDQERRPFAVDVFVDDPHGEAVA